MEAAEIVLVDGARKALAQAKTIDEIKDVRDKAEAIRKYVKQAGYSLEAQNDAAEIKLRAERKAGETIQQMQENGQLATRGGDQKTKSHDVTLNLSDLGLHKMQSRRWQLAAAIPDERFEQHVAEVRDAGKELTSAGVLRLARQLRKEQERLEYRENGHEPGLYSVDDCIAIIGDAREMDLSQFPTKYGVIIADPPWPYRVSRKRGVAEEYYNTMTDEEIAAVPVAELAADDCVLFLWTTWPKVPVALDVIKAWGFDYVSGFPWVKATTTSNPKSDIREIKLSFGVGFWFRGMTEVIFLARKGKPKLPDMAYAGILAPNMEHSKKPESVHQIAREMTGPYLELFARETRPGWTVFGNNIQGKLV